MYWINSAIGLLLMFGIPLLPPVAPITEIGMQIGGIFLGALYLWSTVDIFWPSLVALVALGFTDYADMSSVLQAFSADVPLLMMFGMILFGAISDCGLTQYIARWFLTRRVMQGRPAVFSFVMLVAAFFISSFVETMMVMLMLWPTLVVILKQVGYTAKDAYFKILIIATFIAATLGQCTLPFIGGQLVILGAYQEASGISLNYGLYMLFNVVMSLTIMLILTLVIKFVLRPDMRRLKELKFDATTQEPLPPMSIVQKIYILVAILFMLVATLPYIIPDCALTDVINRMGLIGFSFILIALLMFLRIDGKPVLEPSKIRNYVMMDLFVLVTVAIYFSSCLMAEETGISDWLLGLMMPVFDGKGALFFMAALIVTGAVITNFANNAIMGALLMQVIVIIAPSLGIDNTVPLAVTVTMAMFLAVLTPAASPYAAILHASRDYVSTNDIIKYGSVFIAFSILTYIIIGLPVANLIF